MTFNEFNRRLEKCHLDQDTKYLLAHMFEVQVEFSKHLDIATVLLTQLVDKVQSVVDVNDTLIVKLRELQRRGMTEGVEVHSVRNEPDDQ